MNFHEIKTKLEPAFGNLAKIHLAREGGGPQSVVRLEVADDDLPRLIQRWGGLEASKRPRLLGMAPSKARQGVMPLNFLFEVHPECPLFVLEIQWPEKRALPTLAGIWPGAAWWEEELRQFSGLPTESAGAQRGAQWRQP
jgi:Ni,Fe-hydrogenase III component G